jgi:hypothetical protein
LKIELLYFGGCPGYTKVLGILERVIAEEGLATEILPVTPDPEGWSGYLNIPMILVDGEELFPVEHQDLRAATCRIYATPEGQKNYPTAAMVREALAKRSLQRVAMRLTRSACLRDGALLERVASSTKAF